MLYTEGHVQVSHTGTAHCNTLSSLEFMHLCMCVLAILQTINYNVLYVILTTISILCIMFATVLYFKMYTN